MKNEFTNALSTPTPQTEKANERQIPNHAGGFVYQVDDRTRLERLLTLGTAKGTYYQTEKDLTKENLDWLIKLIKDESTITKSVLATVLEFSDGGRTYRNSPAIFTLALIFKYGGNETKARARAALPKICRTSTHLFEFCEYVQLLGADSHAKNLRDNPRYAEGMARVAARITEATGKPVSATRRFSGSSFGGWPRSIRNAVGGWYETKTADELAYQAVKYRQRNGWTHADVIRKAHPKGVDKNVGDFILGKGEKATADGVNAPAIIKGFEAAQAAKTKGAVLTALHDHPKLPWEAIPTQFHKDAEVWKTLFYNGALMGQALVRNITRLARIGAFDDMVFARDYATRLTDEEMIRKTRLHPINFLNALIVHQEGQIDRKASGRTSMYTYRVPKNWNTVPVIVDALNEGFYKAFKYAEPANKRTLIALDISGSMDGPAAGLELTCAQVAGAMAMTIAKTEPYYMVRGFANGGRSYYYHSSTRKPASEALVDLGIAPSMNLSDVTRKMKQHTMGATDCSLPMEWAIANKAEIDTFVVITDSETYAGVRHPDAALRDYRQKSGIDARLIVVGVNATDISIADPNDPGMLDVVGGDSNLPRLIAEFSAGRL